MSIGMDAIMAAAGGGGTPPGPMGLPPMEEESEPAGDTAEIISQIIGLVRQYLDAEDDEIEKKEMTDILAKLQAARAREQKESQDALQGKMSPRLLTKAYGA